MYIKVNSDSVVQNILFCLFFLTNVRITCHVGGKKIPVGVLLERLLPSSSMRKDGFQSQSKSISR